MTNDTTEVYAMPEGALYWYGFGNNDVGMVDGCLGLNESQGGSIGSSTFTINTNSVSNKAIRDSIWYHGLTSMINKTKISKGSYTKLKFDISYIFNVVTGTEYGNIGFALSTNRSGYNDGAKTIFNNLKIMSQTSSSNRQVVTADVSNVTDDFYYDVSLTPNYGAGNTLEVTLHRVWLE